MNSRKSAKAIPSTLNRFLKSRALLKSPPAAFYPLAAHPPPPSLVRSFPARDPLDLAPASPTRTVLDSQARSLNLNLGVRLSPNHLLHPTPTPTPPPSNSARTTRRRPRHPVNQKYARPERIVFPEDAIRKRFYLDHPFEAYRPANLVESDKVRQLRSTERGAEWTELRQTSLNPSPEDCIAFVHHLTTEHGLALATAYPLAVAQFRTLRQEFETATRSARLEADALGAVFFGEIERQVVVEEKVLDGWTRAKDIADAFAASGGSGGRGRGGGQVQQQQQQQSQAGAEWSPVEGRPAQLGSGAPQNGEAEFTGGVEYLRRFDRSSQ